MTLGLKILLCLNEKILDLKSNSVGILRIFSSNKCILVRLWVKKFVSQRWLQAEITTQTL